MKKLLIIGGTRFLGRHLVTAALARGRPQKPATAEPVEPAMNPPERVHEPGWLELRRSGLHIAHRTTSPSTRR